MKTILSFMLACIGTIACGQVYHPLVDTTKLWSTLHTYIPIAPPTSDYIKFEDDTLIGNMSYYHVWHYTNQAMTQRYLDGFIREDLPQQTVYMRYTDVGTEYLLYNFGSNVGDTLYLHDNPFPYVLDSVGTFTLITGEHRRALYFHSAFYYPCYETWVEGIGSLTKGVLNSGSCGFVGDDPKMLCHWEHDTLKYHTPDYPNCFYITGIGDRAGEQSAIRVFPNPATGGITVSVTARIGEKVLFEITDLHGVVVLKREVAPGETFVHLDRSVILPGIYLYRVTSSTGILRTDKLTIL
jgi:hypothetical protein